MINSIQRDQRRRMLVLRFQIKQVQYKALLQNCSVFSKLNRKKAFQLADVNHSLNSFRKTSDSFNRSTIVDYSSNPSLLQSQKPLLHFSDKEISLSSLENQKHQYNGSHRVRRGGTFNKIPRNASVTRVQNRCILTARGRGVLRFCKLSRIRLRELASQGLLSGVSKASW